MSAEFCTLPFELQTFFMLQFFLNLKFIEKVQVCGGKWGSISKHMAIVHFSCSLVVCDFFVTLFLPASLRPEGEVDQSGNKHGKKLYLLSWGKTMFLINPA